MILSYFEYWEGHKTLYQFLYRIETCYDGVWNQDELGIDCGGPCSSGGKNIKLLLRKEIILYSPPRCIDWFHHNDIFETVRVYDRQEQIVEGKVIGQIASGKAQWECEIICDKTLGCESFGFCPGDGCYFSDKILNKNSPVTAPQNDCYTVFKTCDKSK